MAKTGHSFGIATACAIVLLVPAVVLATPWTPAEWKTDGKLRDWVRDRNGNFVDDLIEERSGQVAITVDFNTCVGDPSASAAISYLKTVGDVVYVGKYLTFAVVTGVSVSDTYGIASRPDVAMVELALPAQWTAQNLQAAQVETSPDYSPNTLQNQFGWPGTLNGNGINIAIFDQGIDNTTHPAVRGYDAINDSEGDPSPDAGDWHGTNMAGFAFAMAPQAGLIDIKVGTSKSSAGQAAGWIERALEKIYEKHRDWNVHVVSMSFGTAVSDGKDVLSQLANLLAGQGVVVVGSASHNTAGASVNTPAAASLALAVSAADLNCTVNRGDDSAPTAKGPRVDSVPGTKLILGQHKPELVIPTGTDDPNCSGPGALNSPAAALTSGLAALVLQHTTDLSDFDNKAAGSVKDLLIRTAEPKGTPYADAADYPGSTGTWAQYWGFGEISAHEAFRHLSGQVASGRTDLTFIGFDGTPHPSTPWYFSHAVETQSERDGKNITAGVADTIYANIRNASQENAQRVRVNFGFYPFTGGASKFYDIGSTVVDFPNSSDKVVSMNWTPPALQVNELHGCILVTIDYGYDTGFAKGSNFAQKNVRVKKTSSPAVFEFRVENPLPANARIDLTATSSNPNWSLTLSDTSFNVTVTDCAKIVTATAQPPSGARQGEEALFFVTVTATKLGTEESVEVGGVALRAIHVGGPAVSWLWWLLAAVVVIAAIAAALLLWRAKPQG